MRNRDDLRPGMYPSISKKEEVGSPTDKVSMDPETKYGTIIRTEFVKMRAEVGGDLLMLLKKGERVEILSKLGHGDYWKVKARGKMGFILSRFCKEE